ncbi:glutaredoxin-related protein 5, mitochondrial-like [Corticium candelabrum]|uniref:glutaredoxin-related protein 5, mitochondrial-like n=1 Tax=Corticium candelabrum TaxID=121492 RepID=UPI002E26945B|nr:glutaredoxin-related protein 5, mitochondrial-like [Corticium candelabrum]
MFMSTTGKAATVVVGSLIGSYALWKCLSNHPTSNLKSTESTGSHEYLHKLVSKDKVVVFMKGDPLNPRCRYSKQLVDILKEYGVNKYASYDVLKDPAMRSGIKKYSDWPTLPQLFFKGQFVGGVDIVTEMHHNGQLGEELRKAGIRSKLAEKQELQQLGIRTALLEKHKFYRNK